MSLTQEYYDCFKNSVRKRLTKNCAIPSSGGLDSTLIIKAVCDLGLQDNCFFLCYGENDYIKTVETTYDINIHYFDHNIDDFEKYLFDIVGIWEEPFYWISVGYFLYKEIQKKNIRVSISGLGPDELCGGYSYYNTDKYPRGIMSEIKAVSNEEKFIQDRDLLVYHHLRKNDKLGLRFDVEGRYPYLDMSLQKYNTNCFQKSLIKKNLLLDFPEDFVNRPKTGFIMEWIDDTVIENHIEKLKRKGFDVKYASDRQKMFLCQFNIWLEIYNIDHRDITYKNNIFKRI